MEEYLKRCESAMKSSKAMEEGVQMISGKKRKLYSKLDNEYCGDVESAENCVSPAASRTSSGCSKHDESNDVVKENLRSPDLKNVDTQSDDSETEISTSINGGVFSREATPTSEFCGDSEEVLLMSSSSTSKKTPEIPLRKIPSEKMPSAAELEEFFAAAEKCEQKRFAEKYNYDIVKDVPLEGKYQWVRLRL